MLSASRPEGSTSDAPTNQPRRWNCFAVALPMLLAASVIKFDCLVIASIHPWIREVCPYMGVNTEYKPPFTKNGESWRIRILKEKEGSVLLYSTSRLMAAITLVLGFAP